jgi:hypothetical protein
MNEREYRIYYQNDGPSKADPLGFIMSSDQIAYHLEQLPTSLRLHIDNTDTRVETEPAPQEVGGGLYVTLLSGSVVDKLDDLFSACIIKVNNATSGLCFVIDKVVK